MKAGYKKWPHNRHPMLLIPIQHDPGTPGLGKKKTNAGGSEHHSKSSGKVKYWAPGTWAGRKVR